MSFGEILRLLRNEKGMTQQDVADVLNVGRATIAGYETKGKQPDYEKLDKLAELFDVSTDYLLGRTDNRGFYYAIEPVSIERLERLCKRDKITIHDLATALGANDKNVLFRMLKARGVASKDLVKRIAEYFAVDVDYLYNDRNTKQNPENKSLEDYIQEAESLMLYGEIVDENDREALLTAIRIAYETAIKKNREQKKDQQKNDNK